MQPSLKVLLKQQYCHKEVCSNYGKVGQNLGIYSRKQRQLYCKICRQLFAIRKETFLSIPSTTIPRQSAISGGG